MGSLTMNASSQTAAGSRVVMTETIKANNPAGTTHAAGDQRSAGTTMAIEDVTLRYGDVNGVLALDDVSLQVAKNEFCVIVGPSGCGKSSLLYLAAGLNDATSGSIKVDGREVIEPGPDRGMVFQSYTLFPWLTVRANIEYGPKRKGLPAEQRRQIVDQYLNEVGLAPFADHYPAQLSGGMKQRVAIARALANDPAVLLMDEPFGALDSQTRGTMQKLLLRVWERQQKTVLFVTHDIDEALVLGDRVLVMTARPGKIKAEIKVDIPRPRSMDVILEPDFIALKRRILGLLHDEIDEDH
ncbi:MAG: ATP-binding cassette domain-containing protein [Mesorhizobium sp.]|nr:ABC transporter ATP-binding protein [Mesorhizobium sp. M2A.F.Ca.ET.043.02.1.1]RUW37003.1 ABC transporter ATP-binding protein [Mesorhizobium sp. M2A.F.Ca.ET.015.02.1.1]RUW78563.1 ABC transporter ATP-binding protein [Mesorhizobium sp. M2A.F.Ca.ET.067.02.1.1]RVC91528.1 ABC transporter ATP-binding protein [Mesorhizobium sp. M2A.F.Ca.ET.017.03.2.1]RVD06130.1 ABC transporter ATP-binding protein [Mesorhizobium sp. M2A.F.Ca.ET.029.05.1.1]RWB46269.1 MAG: ABC transporter ATP-binding protein [Mesorhiz